MVSETRWPGGLQPLTLELSPRSLLRLHPASAQRPPPPDLPMQGSWMEWQERLRVPKTRREKARAGHPAHCQQPPPQGSRCLQALGLRTGQLLTTCRLMVHSTVHGTQV